MNEPKSLPQKRIHHSRDGIHIFVNPYWGGKFVTDDTGAKVIELMDRESDEEKLVDLISTELGINPYEAGARFVSFLEQLERRRMLGEVSQNSVGVPRPSIGFLEITRKCATRCRLCYVDSGVDKPDTLTKEEIFEVVDQMAELGIDFVALSGGDPLTREDLPEIMAHIRKRHDIVPGLSTSLLTLTEDMARELKELGALVQVSLDGSTAEINDWNRGKGSFDKTMAGLELLKRYEVPFRFAFVINKHNVGDVENMVALGLELGAKEVAFGKVRIAGRAQGQEAMVCPGIQDLATAYHDLYVKDVETRETGLVIRCKHNQALLTGLHDRVGCLPCGAGRTFIQVSYNGDIVPCSLLSNEKELSLGNVRKDKLRDVWVNSPVYEFFRRTTVEDIEVCKDCPARYLCGGGCRADAYLNDGDIRGPCGDCKDLVHYYAWTFDHACSERNVTAF
jgi:radical SAM protein with 4Fe4S-binding SPASM domain